LDSRTDKSLEDFLLAEYQYFGEAFRRSEDIGEQRLNFFVAILTAVFGGIIVILTNPPQENLLLASSIIVIFMLLVALIFGLLTLLRIIKRNITSDHYKNDLDRIRYKFKMMFKNRLADYPIYQHVDPRLILTGGLADITISLNSLIVGCLISFMLIDLDIWFLVAVFLVVFSITFVIQQVYILRHYYKDFFKIKGIRPREKLFRSPTIITQFIIAGIFFITSIAFAIINYPSLNDPIPSISVESITAFLIIVLYVVTVIYWFFFVVTIYRRYLQLTKGKYYLVVTEEGKELGIFNVRYSRDQKFYNYLHLWFMKEEREEREEKELYYWLSAKRYR
jgi:hypothetical protein